MEVKIHDFFNSGSKVSSWGHLDLVWSPTCGELCKMAFPAPLGKKGGTAQTTYEPFTRVPLASHGFPSFWEKDGISDSTASLSSCALALIAENGSAPSRFGHEQQGLLDINQGESGERGGLGGTVRPTLYPKPTAGRIVAEQAPVEEGSQGVHVTKRRMSVRA